MAVANFGESGGGPSMEVKVVQPENRAYIYRQTHHPHNVLKCYAESKEELKEVGVVVELKLWA